MKMKEFKTAGGVASGWGFGHLTTYYLYGCSRRPSRRCGGQSLGPKSSRFRGAFGVAKQG